ncbi:hypothetical protein [Lactobacillus helveticus]|uniref:hypothetical protein n=1 Tax=Lactobacillus helveticus TaxID=1587 RepID=UPI00156383FD|nr:hypothetical protein [Lactobacillus helveticus]NRO19200.1 hypothetical protein [Lactobacillus helveticus]
MILGTQYSLSEQASIYKCKRELSKFTKETRYYLDENYTDKKDRVICLVKFVEKKYLLSTLFVNLHFSSLYSFREYEDKYGDHKIGDKYEGIYPCDYQHVYKNNSKNYNHKLLSGKLNTWNPILRITKDGIGFSDKQAKKIGVISFYAIRESNFDSESLYDIRFNREVSVNKINQIVLTMMHNFNQERKIPVVIKMLKDTVIYLKQKSKYSDLVSYVDENSPADSLIVDQIKSNPWRTAFYKRKEYSNQLEYRIVDEIDSHNSESGVTKHFDGLWKNMFIASKDTDLSKFRVAWDD